MQIVPFPHALVAVTWRHSRAGPDARFPGALHYSPWCWDVEGLESPAVAGTQTPLLPVEQDHGGLLGEQRGLCPLLQVPFPGHALSPH